MSTRLKTVLEFAKIDIRLHLVDFFILFCLLCILQTIFLWAAISFKNDEAVTTLQLEEKYDYHLHMTDLSQHELSYLTNKQLSTNVYSGVFKVVRSYETSGSFLNPKYEVFIALRGEKVKNAYKYFKVVNLPELRKSSFGRISGEKIDLKFSPRYDFVAKKWLRTLAYFLRLVIVAVISAILLKIFFIKRYRHRAKTYSFYTLCGAGYDRLLPLIRVEMLVFSLLSFFVSVPAVTLYATKFYALAGHKSVFSMFAFLLFLLFSFFLIMSPAVKPAREMSDSLPAKYYDILKNKY